MFFAHTHSVSQRQSLVVSQQLRQAIVLLQMGNPELQSFIEQQAEENPFLELAPMRPAAAPLQRGVSGGVADGFDQIAALEDTRGPSLYTHVASQIGALGLDVYEQEEQLFFDDHSSSVVTDDVLQRLLTFPNVVVTGHQGFFTREALATIAETTLRNLDDYASGQLALRPNRLPLR